MRGEQVGRTAGEGRLMAWGGWEGRRLDWTVFHSFEVDTQAIKMDFFKLQV